MSFSESTWTAWVEATTVTDPSLTIGPSTWTAWVEATTVAPPTVEWFLADGSWRRAAMSSLST